MKSLIIAAMMLPAALQNLPWLRLDARVDRIIDGNNVRVYDRNGYAHHICLLGSDAPELGQPGGVAARDRLRELIDGRGIVIIHRFVDVAGRTLGNVYIDAVWVNRVLVQEGLAWTFDPFDEVAQLKAFEQAARQRQIGVWAVPKPVPPWFWRQGKTTWREGMEDEVMRVFPRFPSWNSARGIRSGGR